MLLGAMIFKEYLNDEISNVLVAYLNYMLYDCCIEGTSNIHMYLVARIESNSLEFSLLLPQFWILTQSTQSSQTTSGKEL